MNENDPHLDVPRLLSRLGEEFSAVESIVPAVAERLVGLPMQKPRAKTPWILAAAFVCAGFLWMIHRPQATREVSYPTVDLDGASISQRMAALLNAHAVLVGWSYRGGSPPIEKARSRRNGSYLEIPIRAVDGGDGQTYCWSLFIADPQILPALNPPTVHVELADHREIGFGVSARFYPPGELSSAIGSTPVGVDLNQVQTLLQEKK